jgi:hypothetical protein
MSNRKLIGECLVDAILDNATTRATFGSDEWKEEAADMLGHVVHTYLQESEVVQQARKLCALIESLPGGEAATACSMAASNLSRSLEGHWGPYPLTNLTFGQAMEALKEGKRVAREGWNGRCMFLFLLPGARVPKTAIHDPALRALMEEQPGDTFEALPSIRMFTADKKVLTGWLASQTDMFATDYYILP